MGNRKYRKPTDSNKPPMPSGNYSMPSRTARRQAENKPAEKHEQSAGRNRGGRLLSVLFFVFIFLPVFAVFLYVAVLYDPAEEKRISASSNEVSFEENAEPITPLQLPEEPAVDAEETVELPVEEPAATETEVETELETETETASAVELGEEEIAEPASPEAPAELEEPEIEQPAAQQVHTVQKGETLYRIAISYYGTSEAVDAIMQANGLNAPNLSIGQTLILPQ